MNALEQKLISLGSGRVLDLGCGDKKISSHFEDVVTVDLWPACKPDVLLNIGTQKLPFSDEEFDTVYMTDVIEHMHKKCGEFALKEAQRVCAGVLIMLTPLQFDANRKNIRDPSRPEYFRNPYNLHQSLWRLEDFPVSEGWTAHEITPRHYLGVWE